MNKKLRYWLFFGIFWAIFGDFTGFAQEATTLRGRVLNDSLEGSYLQILNLNSQKGTITNDEGIFNIEVQKNDSLYISALQFEPQKIIITEAIYRRKSLEIRLKPAVNELETVTVKDVNLSGRLDQDAGNVKTEPYFDQTNMGFAPTAEKRSPELKALQAASGGGIPGIGTLINIISGRQKILKRNYALYKMEQRVKKASERVETALYIKELGIPENLVDDFIHFVYKDNEEALAVAEQENVLILIEYLKKQAVAYKEMKREQ